jgi:hypothetical protein
LVPFQAPCLPQETCRQQSTNCMLKPSVSKS